MVQGNGATSPVWHPDQAQEWIETLHGASRGLVNVVNNEDWSGKTFNIRSWEETQAMLDHIGYLDRLKVKGIYVRSTTLLVAPAPGRRGLDTDSASLPGLWADIDREGPGHAATGLPKDFAAATAIIEAARLPMPTRWIESGGGWYAWWLLTEPHQFGGDVSDLTEISRLWHEALHNGAASIGLNYERGTHDMARVLRIPGTINRKVEDLPRPCHLLNTDTDGRMFSMESILDSLAGAIPAPKKIAPVAPTRQYVSSGLSPFDDFAQRTSWDDRLLLGGQGWEYSHSRGDEIFWVRPGKNRHDGHSASTGVRDGLEDGLWVFSTSVAEFPASNIHNRAYSKPYVYSVYHHNGDMKAAARRLKELGYGDQTTTLEFDDSWRWEQPAPKEQPPQAAPGPNPLGEDFWDQRDYLKHIKQAAHAQQRSAEAVLGVVLARVAALCSHRLRVPAIVGDPSSLTIFSVVVAPSGVGKSTANAVALRLLEAPEDFADQLPVGTGEGIAEAFYGEEDEEYPDARGAIRHRQVRKLNRHNAFFYLDEGQVLGQLARRAGSTLLQTLRSAFSGSTLGQFNASAERRRIVPGSHYAMGVVIGVQDNLAADLLNDAEGGTPQRCLWFSAIDPSVPDLPNKPQWPGALNWHPPVVPVDGGGMIIEQMNRPYYLHFADEIVTEVQLADLVKVRGEAETDQLDSHLMLVKTKVAALLAILDGRLNVNLEDWKLAGVIVDRSNNNRTRIIGVIETTNRKKSLDKIKAQAAQERGVAVRHEFFDTMDAKRKIIELLAGNNGEMPTRELRSALSSRLRPLYADVLAQLVAEGQVQVVESDTSAGGSAKKTVNLV